MRPDRNIVAVDLFCGVGGLTHGLARSGIRVVAGVDLDEACEFPFEANNDAKFYGRDVASLTADEVASWYPEGSIRLLAGCAPCQPFSTYSRSGRGPNHDEDWRLLLSFGRLVEEIQPELVTMENVPQLRDHEVFKSFLRSLKGYEVEHEIVECSEIGVPQTRKRLVLVASKLGGAELRVLGKARVKASVRETIGKLPPIAAGETSSSDRVHTAPRLSAMNMKRIRASKPGGTWRDWPEALLASCHRRTTGATYPSVYGRMTWDAPAPTMTTQCFGYGNGRFGHPEQDRAISLREAAMLQTFPRDYQFLPEDQPVRFNKLGRLIGNAVPVRLGETVGQSLVAHVEAVLAAD